MHETDERGAQTSPIDTQSDPTEYLAAAMAFAPNATRLDFYDGEAVTATIERKRGLVTLVPKANSAMAWDVRKIPLTEEIDATLAFCESVGSAYFRDQDGSWFSCTNYGHRLWYRASRTGRITQAQAAFRIFQAKTALLEGSVEDNHGIHSGASIPSWLIEAALVGRRVVDVAAIQKEGHSVLLDSPLAPYIRPGDATEYVPYEHEHSIRIGMVILCATMPDDMDPKGAKVEPLYVVDHDLEENELGGFEMVDRHGRLVPKGQWRKIGAAVAYTPKGGETQHAHNGLKFLWGTSPEKRTTYAPANDIRTRLEGRWHFWNSYESLTPYKMRYLFDLVLGGGGTDFDLKRDDERRWEERTVGVRFGSLPDWCPRFDSAFFAVTKEAPAPGSLFYGVWQTDEGWLKDGLAAMLPDGRAMCYDGEARRLADVKVVGHLASIGFDARTEEAPTLSAEALCFASIPEDEGGVQEAA